MLMQGGFELEELLVALVDINLCIIRMCHIGGTRPSDLMYASVFAIPRRPI